MASFVGTLLAAPIADALFEMSLVTKTL